jgi:hypothetical protein
MVLYLLTLRPQVVLLPLHPLQLQQQPQETMLPVRPFQLQHKHPAPLLLPLVVQTDPTQPSQHHLPATC